MTQKYAALAAHHRDIDQARGSLRTSEARCRWLFKRCRIEICVADIAF